MNKIAENIHLIDMNNEKCTMDVDDVLDNDGLKLELQFFHPEYLSGEFRLDRDNALLLRNAIDRFLYGEIVK